MNVDNVKYNLYSSGVQKRNDVPQFRGITQPVVVKSISETEFSEKIKHLMPPFIRGMKKLNDNMGETQNILINALGTGLVAPIFIKWNPLSKTDEDTRTYSAWRQPVSAILTVITQAGITIPVNKFIANLTNKGYYEEDYNKTLFQDKEYIAKTMHNQYPYMTNTQLNAKVSKYIAEQENTLLRMIRENKIIFSKFKAPSAKMNKENFIKLLNNTVEIKLSREKAELDKCNNTRIPGKIKRGQYYQANKTDAEKIFTEIENRLNAASDPDVVKKYVKTLKNSNTQKNPELIKIYEEILAACGNSKDDLKTAMKGKLSGILHDITMYSECDTKENIEQLVRKNVGVRIAQLDNSISILEKIKKAIKDGDTVGTIEKMILKAIDADSDTEHRLKDYKFGEQVAEQFKKQINNNIQGHKQIIGLIVSFLMLPVTCSLLNWSYPRFMDAVFPNLSNKKHPNEIKDLVDKADKKKAEVK